MAKLYPYELRICGVVRCIAFCTSKRNARSLFSRGPDGFKGGQISRAKHILYVPTVKA